jgi:hypothetical protein
VSGKITSLREIEVLQEEKCETDEEGCGSRDTVSSNVVEDGQGSVMGHCEGQNLAETECSRTRVIYCPFAALISCQRGDKLGCKWLLYFSFFPEGQPESSQVLPMQSMRGLQGLRKHGADLPVEDGLQMRCNPAMDFAYMALQLK